MTKQYPIILLNNEMYMIGELAKYNGTRQNIFCLAHPNDFGGLRIGADTGFCELCHVVLASSDKTLNLPLLPVVEKTTEQLSFEVYPPLPNFTGHTITDVEKQVSKRIGFIEGYKANTKKWSDEDVIKAMNEVRKDYDEFVLDRRDNNEIIESLQPKPIAVEVEMVQLCHQTGLPCGYPCNGADNCKDSIYLKVDENNFIKVVKWIYE